MHSYLAIDKGGFDASAYKFNWWTESNYAFLE